MGSLLFRGFGEGDGGEEEGEDGEAPSSWQKLDLLDLTTVTSRRGGTALFDIAICSAFKKVLN